MGGDWQAIVLGVTGLVAAAVSAQAETVRGGSSPDLSVTSAAVSVTTSDGEGVNLGDGGLPSKQGSSLPVTALFVMNEQAGIALPNGDVATGYENAQAFATIYDTMFFGHQGGYDFLLNAMANNNNPYGATLGSASASTTLTFQFEVSMTDFFAGPNLDVPLVLDGNTSGNGDTNFEITITDSTGKIVYDTGQFEAGNSIDEFFEVARDEVYTVTTQANVFVAGNGTANLLIDPILVIDPSFAFAQDFALQFSPGLFPTVPEPPTAALLSAPLAAMLWWRRRRKPLGLNIGAKTPAIEAQI